MHEGKYIRIEEWRAIQAAAKAQEASPAPAVDEPAAEEAPRTRRPRQSKRDAAAQVMAAMGIDPAAAQDTELTSPTGETGTEALAEALVAAEEKE
jgi:hypothetical protein